MFLKRGQQIQFLSKEDGGSIKMTPSMFAVCLTCLLLGRTAQIEAQDPSATLQLLSVNVGEEFTLECFYENKTVGLMFYWYKQTLGEKPKIVSRLDKHDRKPSFQGEFKDNQRFELEVKADGYNLKISDAQYSDSATYYCMSGYLDVFEFLDSTVVTVKDSSLNIQASVHQSASELIQPGGSLTLNCTVQSGTCDRGHSVYWFKNSGEAHPGILYSHGARNDQCERKPHTQTHTCVYNLPMKSLDSSHRGTYYCAVAACGAILFGNGTTLDFGCGGNSPVLVYFLSGALTFTTILVVVLTYTTLKTHSCQHSESTKRSSVSSAPKAENFSSDYMNSSLLMFHPQMIRRRTPAAEREEETVVLYTAT